MSLFFEAVVSVDTNSTKMIIVSRINIFIKEHGLFFW